MACWIAKCSQKHMNGRLDCFVANESCSRAYCTLGRRKCRWRRPFYFCLCSQLPLVLRIAGLLIINTSKKEPAEQNFKQFIEAPPKNSLRLQEWHTDQYLSSFLPINCVCSSTQSKAAFLACLIITLPSEQTCTILPPQTAWFVILRPFLFLFPPLSDCLSFALSKFVINPYNLRNVISASKWNTIRAKWEKSFGDGVCLRNGIGMQGNRERGRGKKYPKQNSLL